MARFNLNRPVFLVLFMLLVLSRLALSQKVGLVFSGGAAHGLTHIGVLKALEENNIPVDYITGTSMGGIVGGFYAAGYSPYEIEYIALTKDFQQWVSGEFYSEYKNFFRKKEDNASVLSVKLSLDSNFSPSLRPQLVNDIPLNFALQQLLCQASANAGYNFDSLFVPFRCMVSDVFLQRQITLKNGSLNDALRATLTVPYIFRPIKINNKYVFDGGLYNNFPVDVMKQEFKPDVIIGVNVSDKVYEEYPFDSDEELISRLFIIMFLARTDSASVGKSGIYIKPDVNEYSVVDFTQVQQYIKKGYDATIAKMPEIKRKIKRVALTDEILQRRKAFISRQPQLVFSKIQVSGVNSRQQQYVQKMFRTKDSVITLADIKRGYYKLVADDNFQTVYPRINYDPGRGQYEFTLDVKPERNLKMEIGGNVSSRPVNGAYLGMQYNFLQKRSYTFTADFNLGRLYEAIELRSRVDFPGIRLMYMEGDFTYNHWDYFKSSDIVIEDIIPTFLDQTDRRISVSLGMPARNNGKVYGWTSFVNIADDFSQDNTFKSNDTLDQTRFNAFSYLIAYEKSSLNARQFPTGGRKLHLAARFTDGVEQYFPGSTSLKTIPQSNRRNWMKLDFNYEGYLKPNRFFTFGYKLDMVLTSRFDKLVSNQPFFSTYRGSLISAPVYYPLFDSRTIFLQNYRAYNYAAFGLINNFNLSRNFNLRLEGYAFQPHRQIIEGQIQEAAFSKPFEKRFYAAAASIIYTTPIAPISFSINYYQDPKRKFGFLFNVGYMIFNKRALE